MPVAALVATPAAQVACGAHFSLVLSDAGDVLFSFGANESGQLGRATMTPDGGQQAWDAAPTPVERDARSSCTHVGSLPEGVRLRHVSGGARHALCVSAVDGAVYSWGGGAHGCLGHGHGDDGAQPRPRRLEGPLRGVRVTQVAAGDDFSLAVDAAGALWSWGCGDEGRLGHGDEESRGTPARVAALLDQSAAARTPVVVRAASAGGDHALVLSEAGEVFSFGCGDEGQLGHGDDRANQPTPTRVAGLTGVRVAEVSAGFFYSAARTEGGALHTWGNGEGGKLGHGDEEEQPAPMAVGALDGCLV